MNINGVAVYPGHPCPHSTGQGCNDYANRPKDPCIDFNCGWVLPNSPLPDWMKPDNGKVIVIFNKLDWHGHPVDLAVPVARRIPTRALNWLKNFSEKNMRPLIYTEQIKESGKYQKQQLIFGYGPQQFQDELARWQQEGKTFW